MKKRVLMGLQVLGLLLVFVLVPLAPIAPGSQVLKSLALSLGLVFGFLAWRARWPLGANVLSTVSLVLASTSAIALILMPYSTPKWSLLCLLMIQGLLLFLPAALEPWDGNVPKTSSEPDRGNQQAMQGEGPGGEARVQRSILLWIAGSFVLITGLSFVSMAYGSRVFPAPISIESARYLGKSGTVEVKGVVRNRSRTARSLAVTVHVVGAGDRIETRVVELAERILPPSGEERYRVVLTMTDVPLTVVAQVVSSDGEYSSRAVSQWKS